jgi:thiol-disulfide isomerase/thioredoxin
VTGPPGPASGGTRPGPGPARRLTLVAAASLLVLGGCSGEPAGPGPAAGAKPPQQESRVDVDTPELRAIKEQAGIEQCEPGPAGETPAADQRLPDLTLPCLGGGPAVDLAGLRGPLVINLFAQWCGPCRDELPFYQRLHREAAEQVDVLGIDYLDTQPAGALELAAETGVTFPLLADPDGLLRTELRIRGLPGIVLVDRQGRTVAVEFTVIRSYAQLTGLVNEHLGLDV